MNLLKPTVFIISFLVLIHGAHISDYKENESLQKSKHVKRDEEFSSNKIFESSKRKFNTQHIDRKFSTANDDNGNAKNSNELNFSKYVFTGKLKRGYNLLSTKWHKLIITYRLVHKNKKPFINEEENIHIILRDTFNVWEKDSKLKFTEITEGIADIMISFEQKNHTEIDWFEFSRRTTAHAFQPGEGLGGDLHFNEGIKWDFNLHYNNKVEDGKVSFYRVALHMIGHSLGLGHTRDRSSVMYGYIFKLFRSLSVNDVKGIQHIYGIPQSMKNVLTHPVIDSNVSPNKCNTSYDAIAMIDDELVAFKGKYMFGPNMDVIEIRSRWIHLSPMITHVDVVFQTSDQKVLFFINQDVYIFNENKLEKRKQLLNLGIDSSAAKVDIIFRMPNNKVIMFIGSNFYEFDDLKLKVVGSVQKIVKNFTDVYDMETAFTYNDGRTYFFKEQNYYEFDNKKILKRMEPKISSTLFMNCVINHDEKEDEAARDFMDVIVLEPKLDGEQEAPEVGENIQKIKELKMVAPNIASSNNKSHSIVIYLFISIGFYHLFFSNKKLFLLPFNIL